MSNQKTKIKYADGGMDAWGRWLSKGGGGCRGIVLTEVLLAFGVLSVAFAVVLPLFWQAIDAMGRAAAYAQAAYLLEEQLEVVEFIRNEGWMNLSDGRFVIAPVAGAWSLVGVTDGEVIGDFTRWVEISSLRRDASGAIVESGGEIDESSKKVTAVVEWSMPRSGRMEREIYLTRYMDNLSWVQTTQEEFNLGELDYVETTLVNDGEFQLAGGECGPEGAKAKIYSDQLENGWGVNTIRADADVGASDPTYNGSSASIRAKFLTTPSWSLVQFENKKGVCTLGFKLLRFYVFNGSETEELNFSVRAEQSGWAELPVVVPANQSYEWFEVILDYSELTAGATSVVTRFEFCKENVEQEREFWVDQVELTGGIEGGGGYYQEGTLISQVFDAENETTFNQITWDEIVPVNTRVGFQVAVSDSGDGPWEYYGPGGTMDAGDRYIQGAGSGIYLGQNRGRYMRWKAFLNTDDGLETPVVEEVIVNYSP